MPNTEDIIEQLSQNLQPVTVASCPYNLSFKGFALTAVYIATVLAISGFREDLAIKLMHPLFFAEISILMVTITSCLLAAFFLSFPDVCQKKYVLAFPFVSFLLFSAILLIEYWYDNAAAGEVLHGAQCVFSIGIISFIPALLMFRAISKQATTYCCTAGAVTLLFASSIGIMILRLSEKVDSLEHIIGWHYLPLMGFGIVGMFLGKKILRW